MNAAGFRLGLVVALIVPGLVYSDCADPDNGVDNCGFEAGISPWYAGAAEFTVTNVDARSGIASAELDAGFNSVSSTYLFQLGQSGIPVEGGTTYALGAFFKRVSGDPLTNRCRVQWAEWEICPQTNAITSGMTGHLTPSSSSWREARTVFTTDPDTACVRVLVDCLGAPTDFVARVDDVYLIRALFADGFETEDTSGWSATTP